MANELYKVKITVIEERDLYVNARGKDRIGAQKNVKDAIKLMGLSNIKIEQESITETQLKIDDIDYDEVGEES